MRILPSALITFLATSAAADVTVTFRDGAPKDRFTITNVAACATGPFDLTIDLAGSPSNLILTSRAMVLASKCSSRANWCLASTACLGQATCRTGTIR